MARPQKYSCADDLLNNTRERGDCLLWPDTGSSVTSPVISSDGPMARLFMTNSVPRILFTICRHIPDGRLVRCCDEPWCVNPYHYVESNAIRKKRKVLSNPSRPFISRKGVELPRMATPTSLLPKQEDVRHLLAPDDETLAMLRPKDPNRLLMLANAAAVAGFDGKGILNRNNHFVPSKFVPIHDARMPVLQLRGAKPAPPPPEDTELDNLFEDVWLNPIKAYKEEQERKKAERLRKDKKRT